jgi:hypothetical protein
LAEGSLHLCGNLQPLTILRGCLRYHDNAFRKAAGGPPWVFVAFERQSRVEPARAYWGSSRPRIRDLDEMVFIDPS